MGKNRWINQIKDIVNAFGVRNARCHKCHAVLSLNALTWKVEMDREKAIECILPICLPCSTAENKEHGLKP